MGFEEHLSLLEGGIGNFLPDIERSNSATVGQEWATVTAKVVSLAKQLYLVDGDVLSYKRLLALNVDAKILLLKRLCDDPSDRFRCSGLYGAVLEAMSIGLWDNAAEIVRLSNAEFVPAVEHITDFQYARFLGHACSVKQGTGGCISVSDIDVQEHLLQEHLLQEHLLQENSIFKSQVLFIQAVLNGVSDEANRLFLDLVQLRVINNGPCERADFMQKCDSAKGDVDAESALVYDLDDVDGMIDIELLALVALARRYNISLPLEDYDYCPLDLQMLSSPPDSVSPVKQSVKQSGKVL